MESIDKQTIMVSYEQKSAKAGCFVPVDPQFALDYHGNTFSIDGIRIETEDGVNGGLFGNAVTARNVMIDGCYVGGLIGALDGEMTVGQCFVAAGINDSGSSGGYSGGTGGLIGVRPAAHVSSGCKSRIRPVVGRI